MCFDIEDDPTRGVTELFGLLINEQGSAPVFQYFLAKRPEDEEATIQAFGEFLLTAGEDVYDVYLFAQGSEYTQAAMERYDLDPAVLETYTS